MPNDWRAAAWFLEHGPSRQDWKKVHEVSGGPDKPLKLDFTLTIDRGDEDDEFILTEPVIDADGYHLRDGSGSEVVRSSGSSEEP